MRASKEQFEQDYCESSNITKEEYDKYFVTLPCNCDFEGCKGWACVSNHPLVIKAHEMSHRRGIGNDKRTNKTG